MRYIRSGFLAGAALAMLMAIAAPAIAQDLESRIEALEQELKSLRSELQSQIKAADEKAGSGARTKMKGPSPTWESEDGRHALALTGRIHFDAAIYSQDGVGQGQQDARVAPDLNSGTNFRRARIGVKGKIDKDWRYEFIADGGGSPAGDLGIDVANIAYKGIDSLTITAGKYKAPGGFEEATSSNDSNFIERSIATDLATANAGGKRIGVGFETHGERWYAGAGLFSDEEFTEADDEQLSVNGRVAIVPIMSDDTLLHFGASGWYLAEPSQDGDERVQWRDRPEIRVDSNRWIDAQSNARIANDDAYMWGLEAVGAYGPFWAQAEYFNFGMSQMLDPAGAAIATPDLDYQAYYIQLGYILTGERKPYSIKQAEWKGIKPNDPFSLSSGGWGALEIAGRYSYADLNDEENTVSGGLLAGTRGGIEQNWTLGVNWYPNPYIRFMLNYINVDVDRLDANGLQQGDNFDVYAMRMQVKW